MSNKTEQLKASLRGIGYTEQDFADMNALMGEFDALMLKYPNVKVPVLISCLGTILVALSDVVGIPRDVLGDTILNAETPAAHIIMPKNKLVH